MSDQNTEAEEVERTEDESAEHAATDGEVPVESDEEEEVADTETGAGDTADAGREALEAAIAENPEEVARFVERLGLVNDLLDTTELATSAMDDEMVQRLSGTSSLLLESADGLATPGTTRLAGSVGQNANDLDAALGTLLRLQRSGTLDELADLADAATLLTAAMDDEMVQRLARTGGTLGEVVDTAAEPETARGLERLLRAVGEAGGEDPEAIGAVGLVRALRDEEVRRGMGFLVALARGLGQETTGGN